MIKKISLLAISCFSFSNLSQASIEASLTNICAIVQADDKTELRKKLKSVEMTYNLRLRDYYDGVQCDGNSLIRTAVQSNAIEVGTLLVKKMPKKHLSSPEKDGKTLLSWISEQGLDGTAVAAVVKDRI